jgi:uncharacterized protein
LIWIDVHSHPGRVIAEHLVADGEELLALQRNSGLAVTVVSSITAITGELEAGNADASRLVEANADAVMFLVLTPLFWKESMLLLDEYTEMLRVVGVKIHPRLGQYPITSAAGLRMLAEVERRGLPVLTHTVGTQIPEPVPNVCTIYQIREVAERFPGIPFIAAHMGMTDHLLSGPEQVAQCRTGNLYIDTASIELAHRGLIEKSVEIAGSGRILFGTDSPIHDPKAMRFIIENSCLDDEAKKNIASRNALRVLPKLAAALEPSSLAGG